MFGNPSLVERRIHTQNIQNAAEILAKGSKEQIYHLVSLYNDLAAKHGGISIAPEKVSRILRSRGLAGFGIDLSAIGDLASSIGSGLADIAKAVGPIIIQKYQIDKLPSMTPAASVTPPPAPVKPAEAPSVKGKGAAGGGTNWAMYALIGVAVIATGGLALFFIRKKKQ